MQQSQGFIDPTRPNYIYKLNKTIYSLKWAPRAWFAQLSSWLLNYGFRASQANPSLFILNFSNTHIYLLVYANDIVVIAFNPQVSDRLITNLSNAFSVKDLGQLSYFLGVEVDHTPIDLLLCQKKCIKDLLLKSNMIFAKPQFPLPWLPPSSYLNLTHLNLKMAPYIEA